MMIATVPDVTDSSDIVRDLPAALADRAAAWSCLRRFAASWGTPLTADDGTPEADLAEAERRLGLRLPPALREAYALLGRRTDLHGNLHRLRAPDALAVEDDALAFRDENQGACRWGVLLADLDQDDPPVRIRPDLADESAERWDPWLDRFSVAMLEIVLSEVTQGPEELCDFRDDFGEDDAAELRRRLPCFTLPLQVDGDELPVFYAGPGFFLYGVYGALSVRARDTETLERVTADFPGDWLNA